MNKEKLKPESHVLIRLLDPPGATVPGVYVGWMPMGGYEMALVRDSSEADASVLVPYPFDTLVLDPAHHYDKSLAPDGYGENCLCGHHYGRHFDGYEQDDLYPDLPHHAGCKYCNCHCFVAQTPENTKHHLFDRHEYRIRLTRPIHVHEVLGEDEREKDYPAGHEFVGVRVYRNDSIGQYVVRYTFGDALEHESVIWDLPVDAVEVLDSRDTEYSTEG